MTGVLGEAILTVGVVLLLFLAYDLYWTNVRTEQVQSRLFDQITDRWQRERQVSRAAAAPQPRASSPEGEGFAVLHIPSLGPSARWVVVEGVSRSALESGPGHYPNSARPGERGNLAIAGHRATNGEPFRDLDRLRAGHAIVVQTGSAYFTYVVERSFVTKPTDTGVVLPVPRQPNAVPTEALITLTTCHPRWSSEQRLIVVGRLADARATDSGPPPALRS